MRTFIALELPDAFVDEASDVARRLERVVEGRFSRRDAYHLTLAFLGEIGESQSHDAVGALEAACAEAPAVRLHVDGLGKFGRASDATLWLSLVPDDGLVGLAGRVRAELDERGLSFDDKPFCPHVTLARRARLPRGPLPPLAFPADARACAVTLFKSTLAPEGAAYKPLHTVALGR